MPRKKGVPNKLTNQVRSVIIDIINKEIDHLPDLLNELDPSDRADFLIKLIKQVIPAPSPMAAIDMDAIQMDEKSYEDSLDSHIKNAKDSVKTDEFIRSIMT